MRNERMNGKTRAWPAQTGRAIPTRAAQLQPVWFEHINGTAREVTIAGSFNGWDVSNMPMVRLTGGRWLRVMFLPPGRYEYLFVVDGHCVADPRATESVPNVFGCVNSVVSVPAHAPKNGCVRRIIGRQPTPSPRFAKVKSQLCRSANAPQHALGPNNRG